jgi:Phage integrase, N-terminal SAM-like domain
MGTVYWRDDRSSYYISYILKGRRIRKKLGRSKRQAETALRKIEADIINNKFNINIDEKSMLFKALADYWLENYSKVNNATSQYHKNRERLEKHLIPFFGRTSITEINAKMIDEYKGLKKNGLKPATINRTLAILKKCLTMQ